MQNKVEFAAIGMCDPIRCLICLYEPAAPGVYQGVMDDHIKKHVEDGEITEQMMLEAWKKQSEG